MPAYLAVFANTPWRVVPLPCRTGKPVCSTPLLGRNVNTGKHMIFNVNAPLSNSGLWCQKRVSQAAISKYIPQFTVGCNYLSLPEIPVCFWRKRPQLKMAIKHILEYMYNNNLLLINGYINRRTHIPTNGNGVKILYYGHIYFTRDVISVEESRSVWVLFGLRGMSCSHPRS